jgi:hypothetical protein
MVVAVGESGLFHEASRIIQWDRESIKLTIPPLVMQLAAKQYYKADRNL